MDKNEYQGIILAAGFSRRAGEFKPGLDIFGKPAVMRVAETMAGFVGKIFIVGGYGFEELQKIVGNDVPKIELVYNRNFEKGMFSSFLAGVKKIEAKKFFMIPGDMPFVTPETYKRLLNSGEDIAVPVCCGRKGHPILIDAGIIPLLLEKGEEGNLRDFVNDRGYATVETDDEGILEDIDTPGDYYALLEKYEKKR